MDYFCFHNKPFICSLARKIDCITLSLPLSEPFTPNGEHVPYVIVADNAFAFKKKVMISHTMAAPFFKITINHKKSKFKQYPN